MLAKLKPISLCVYLGLREAPNLRHTIKTFAGWKSSSASVCADDKDVEYSRGTTSPLRFEIACALIYNCNKSASYKAIKFKKVLLFLMQLTFDNTILLV